MGSPSPHKPELPPLLQPGLHRLTLEDLHNLCVDRFPISNTRQRLFDGFCNLKSLLVKSAISVEVWLDGSFLTEKIDPDDVDLVMKIQGEAFCSWSTEQQDLIFWLAETSNELLIKSKYSCHCFAFVVFPPDHPDYLAGKYWHDRWKDKDFGRALRSKEPKGIAVVDISDGSHLRIRSHRNSGGKPIAWGTKQVGPRPLQ